MKNKSILILLVTFCFYLLATTFVGTIGAPSVAYAEGGDPVGPPPNVTDSTLNGDGKSVPEVDPADEDISIIDLIKIIITTKI